MRPICFRPAREVGYHTTFRAYDLFPEGRDFIPGVLPYAHQHTKRLLTFVYKLDRPLRLVRVGWKEVTDETKRALADHLAEPGQLAETLTDKVSNPELRLGSFGALSVSFLAVQPRGTGGLY